MRRRAAEKEKRGRPRRADGLEKKGPLFFAEWKKVRMFVARLLTGGLLGGSSLKV